MINKENKEYTVFLHQRDGDDGLRIYYDLGSGFIAPEDYEFYKSQGYTKDRMQSAVIKYSDLIRIQEEEWAKEKEKLQIHNYIELMKYIYKNLLTDEQKKKIIETAKKVGKKNYKEIIKAYPDIYQQMILFKKSCDEKRVDKKVKIAENIIKTIGLTEEDKEVLNYTEDELYTDMNEFLNNPFVEGSDV